MGIIIDIILIAIILLSSFLGYKKGLVKLGAKLFAGLIAIIITIVIYKPVSEMIINNTSLDEKIQSTIIQNATNIINENQQTQNSITNQLENNILPQQAEDIAKNVVRVITAVVLFIGVKIILSIIISLLDFVASLPILKEFNEMGGIVYGLVRGILIVGVCILLLGAYTKVNPENTLNSEVQNSHLTKIIYEKIVKKSYFIVY